MTTDLDASLQILQTKMEMMTDRYDRDRNEDKEDRRSLELTLTTSINSLSDTVKELSITVNKIDMYQAELNNVNERATALEMQQNGKFSTLDAQLNTQSEQIRDLQINQAGLVTMKKEATTIKNSLVIFIFSTLLGGGFFGYNQMNSNDSNTDKLLIKQKKKMDKSPN